PVRSAMGCGNTAPATTATAAAGRNVEQRRARPALRSSPPSTGKTTRTRPARISRPARDDDRTSAEQREGRLPANDLRQNAARDGEFRRRAFYSASAIRSV